MDNNKLTLFKTNKNTTSFNIFISNQNGTTIKFILFNIFMVEYTLWY